MVARFHEFVDASPLSAACSQQSRTPATPPRRRRPSVSSPPTPLCHPNSSPPHPLCTAVSTHIAPTHRTHPPALAPHPSPDKFKCSGSSDAVTRPFEMCQTQNLPSLTERTPCRVHTTETISSASRPQLSPPHALPPSRSPDKYSNGLLFGNCYLASSLRPAPCINALSNHQYSIHLALVALTASPSCAFNIPINWCPP